MVKNWDLMVAITITKLEFFKWHHPLSCLPKWSTQLKILNAGRREAILLKNATFRTGKGEQWLLNMCFKIILVSLLTTGILLFHACHVHPNQSLSISGDSQNFKVYTSNPLSVDDMKNFIKYEVLQVLNAMWFNIRKLVKKAILKIDMLSTKKEGITNGAGCF